MISGVATCILLAAVNLQTVRDIPYLEGDEAANASPSRMSSCRLDIRYPEGVKDFPTLVWFHGGGLTGGNKGFYTTAESGEHLAEVTCQYRLLGKGGVTNGTDCVDDAAAAVAWTIRHIGEYGGNPKRVFVAGSSAGGYLTMMVAMDPQWLAKYGVKPSDIAGIAPNSGQATTHYNVRKFRGDTRPSVYPVLDEMAPLFHTQNWQEMPRRILCITGEPPWEWKGRAEENELLVATLKALGHPHAQYVRLPFADHGRTVDWGREYIVRFALGEFPADLMMRKEKPK